MSDNTERLITAALIDRFTHTAARDHYAGLLIEFWRSRLCTPHLAHEISTGEDGKFWPFVWEAMLYRHLRSRGFDFIGGQIKKAGQVGPDFGIVHGGAIIWIEAVVPAPEGIPEEFSRAPARGEVRVRSVPHEAVLLRLLGVIKDKQEKIARYLSKGVIGAGDKTVIAVNACRLADYWVDDHGVSQLPMVVEAVFPVGPIAVPISVDGSFGDPVRRPRHSIKKANDAQVPTDNFLNPALAHISAVVGCVQKDMMARDLRLSLVHNPLATNGLPRRLIGAQSEFVADDQGDQYVVYDINE